MTALNALCGNCQKPIKIKYRRRGLRQKFCSRKCRYEFGHVGNCIICDTQFKAETSHTKYCSQRCKEKSRIAIRGQELNCMVCGTKFKVRAKFYSGKFCSKRCAGLHRTLEYPGKLNYRIQAFFHHGLVCSRCGTTEEAVLVVHHKDGNCANIALDNLEVLCANCHHREHWAKSSRLQQYIARVKFAQEVGYSITKRN
jgi:endogenous inhibitor of DNA gyrase (YacG/DUF329 family)